MTAVVSVPGLMSFATFLGFGALARDAGFTLGHALFLTGGMFALPGQVVLIDQIGRGATLAAAIAAVMLTAVRFLPMTVYMLPLIRAESRRPLVRVAAAHLVSATTLIESMRRLHTIPPHLRVAYHFGLGGTLLVVTLLATALGYLAAVKMTPLVAAACLFLTPVYFILSLLATAAGRLDWLAIGIGCLVGPPLYLLLPGLDLMLTGLLGGTAAYALARGMRREPQSRVAPRQESDG